MTDYRSLSLSECVDELLKIDDPLILMHVRPDADTAGSCAALCEIYRALGRGASYLCADEIPSRLDFIFEGLERGDITSGKTAISVDVASPSQLGELYGKLPIALSIDHHEVNTPFSDNYTVGSASSVGEVLYGIALELERRGAIRINERIARHLYTAISSDTGNFAYSNATASTYRIAAELIGYGIDHADINHRLFNSKAMEAIRAEGFIGTKLKTGAGGRIAYATVSREEIDKLSLSFSDFECAIDVVRALRGAEIAFVVKETADGDSKVSLRSLGADVATVAARHSGGGHIRAAGCTFFKTSPEDAAEALLSELEEILK